MVRFDAVEGFAHGEGPLQAVATSTRDLALTDEVAGAARPQPLTLTLTCVAPARAHRGFVRGPARNPRSELVALPLHTGGACRVGPGACTLRALDPDIGLVRPRFVVNGRSDPDYLPTFTAQSGPD